MLLSGRGHFGRTLNQTSLLVVVSVEFQRARHLLHCKVLRKSDVTRLLFVELLLQAAVFTVAIGVGWLLR